MRQDVKPGVLQELHVHQIMIAHQIIFVGMQLLLLLFLKHLHAYNYTHRLPILFLVGNIHSLMMIWAMHFKMEDIANLDLLLTQEALMLNV